MRWALEFVIYTIISGLISSLFVFLFTNYSQKREENVRVYTKLIGCSYQIVKNCEHEELIKLFQ